MVERKAARRAVRRERVVTYLIDAYRQLDDASNRAPVDATRERELAIERAISDIQLFGSAHEVRLADEFSREFVNERSADTTKLLEMLRKSLRAELELKSIGERKVWLRIAGGDPWTNASSLVQARLPQLNRPSNTAESLAASTLAPAILSNDAPASIVDRFRTLTATIAVVLGIDEQSPVSEVLSQASSRLSRRSNEGLDGLRIMARLAEHDHGRVGPEEVAEFDALAEGFEFAIRRELAPTN